MSPDLEQLRALVAVVDTGSFDAAARVLHVTPSAVSQRIKALEQSAGQVLVRRSRPVAPTDAGRAYLRLARAIDSLVAETAVELESSAVTTLPLAVNADSLDTWVLPALAAVSDRVCFDLRREDQADTAALLRDGTVVAAITSEATAVQGCRATPLGTMTYRPAATPDVVDRWFPDGPAASSLGRAPVVVFDRRDRLQDDYLALHGVTEDPPRHHVPASRAFLDAVLLGLGWGMLPAVQLDEHLGTGALVALDDHHVAVDLYWQQWSLRTAPLEATAAAIRSAAAAVLV